MRIIVPLKDWEWNPIKEEVIDNVDASGIMVAQRMLPARMPLASSTSPAKDEPGVLHFKMSVEVLYYPSNDVAMCTCPEFLVGPQRCWHTDIVKSIVRDSALCQAIIAKGVVDRNDPS